jgi:hypothetical protein
LAGRRRKRGSGRTSSYAATSYPVARCTAEARCAPAVTTSARAPTGSEGGARGFHAHFRWAGHRDAARGLDARTWWRVRAARGTPVHADADRARARDTHAANASAADAAADGAGTNDASANDVGADDAAA